MDSKETLVYNGYLSNLIWNRMVIRWHIWCSISTTYTHKLNKSLERDWCSTDVVYSNIPIFSNVPTLQCNAMWQIQKTIKWLSVTWNLLHPPNRIRMTYFYWVWSWCSSIKYIKSSTFIANMLQSAVKHLHISLHSSPTESCCIQRTYEAIDAYNILYPYIPNTGYFS